MDFGRLPINEVGKTDFRLPAEPERNSHVLAGQHANGKVYIGMPQWGTPAWVGSLYPDGTKQATFLSYYTGHFNTVELNATHYNIFDEKIISKWAGAVNNAAFRFCPKMFKGVTHSGNLDKKVEVLIKFLDSVKLFGKYLGPIFIQLSEYFSANKSKELFLFAESLPTGFQFFLELRHPSLLNNVALFDYLQTKNIGAVITDTAGRRDCAHMQLTVPKTMIRFVCNDGHPSDYTRIDEWAVRIKSWLDRGMEEVYFFVHMQDEKNSLAMANYVIEKINATCHLTIPPIKLH